MRTCVFTALLLSSVVMAVEPSIIPRPTSLKTTAGGYAITAQATIHCDAAFKSEGDYLAQTLRACTGFELKTASEANIRLRKIDDESLGAEGYLLSVNANGVEIGAATPAGAFYRVKTLLSMLPTEVVSPKPVSGVKWFVAGVEIKD